MARISKSPEKRRKELIETATELFEKNGYTNTSVTDITDSIDVAKGTFYYYFDTKADILEAAIDNIMDRNIATLKEIVEDEEKTCVDKIREIRLILTDRYRKDYGLLGNLDRLQDSKAHYNWLIRSVEEKSKLISIVIDEGIEEGIFETNFSYEISQIMTVLAIFLFDPKIFTSPKEDYVRRLKALEDMFEKTLGVESGTFDFISKER